MANSVLDKLLSSFCTHAIFLKLVTFYCISSFLFSCQSDSHTYSPSFTIL
uniref:Uncharacterized protein n=1 Tax=Anguilla anguilla TaxID=7936 RepID=A0A0E9QE98_ANGAN